MGAGRSRRTGLILIVLILLILVIGVAAIFLLQGFLGGGGTAEPGGGQDVAEVPTTTPPPTVNIIVAARDIPRGARLTVQDVSIMRWPLLAEAPPPIDALVVAEGDGAGLEQVEGRIARVDIITGQPVLDFMLTPGDEPTSLGDLGSDAALLIPSGSVMITIPITRISAAGYSLREGDHVDVFASYSFVDVDEDFQSVLPNEAIILTDNPELVALGIQQFQYVVGRRETGGPFGSTLLVIPNSNNQQQQIPRQTTQLVIDNAVVVRMGTFPLADLNQPIVITPAPPPTPSQQQEEGAPDQAAGPTPTAIPAFQVPDVISLAMSRQDALVLKYSLEMGAKIDLVLRSALDDDINNIVTDPVTQEYIINFYNVQVPAKLPQAFGMNLLGFDEMVQNLAAGAEETPTEGQ